MSNDLRRKEMVYDIIQALFAEGKTSVRPGDVNARLRERNSPMGSWEVRAEFTRLESDGRIVCQEETGAWLLNDKHPLKDAG